MTTLYAATSNPGKLREFAQAAAPADIQILPLPNIALIPPPEENAPTFAGNAELKATFYSQQAPGLLVFADDSGLEVEALDGRPGILSARFADSLNFDPQSEGSSAVIGSSSAQQIPVDQRNNRCLLSLLHELETAGAGRVTRAARFVCSLALARDGQILLRAEGILDGDLLDTPRGTNGFGYDPLFVLRNQGLTLAELAPEEKWSISHRGNAFRNLLHGLSSASL